jgi:tetratricopeptide (TPR) repeat protein/cellulose synthase/poly-beta-1,6-N-acetylglucosamine synthase-like glycosyltransferase
MRSKQLGRKGVILFSSAVAVVYLFYRILFTLNLTTAYAVFASLFLLAGEFYGVVTMLLYFLQVWDTTEPPQQPVLEGRTVDVFVPTYNEDPDLLRVTLQACVAMDYPHRTYLCDDGGTDARVNDPEKGPASRKRQDLLKAMCAEVGAIYVTRPKNEHAKAGNLNHAFAETDGEFIIIFDADHVPDRHFITRLIGYFADEKLAFVQTPHAFYNFESFQARLNHEAAQYWEEGQLFYHVIQPGRNRWNAAIFAGSAAMFRRKALAEVGYIAVETITEDMHTGLRMHMAGWKSLGISERMISGQAAQDVTTFHSQRLRWGEGNLSVLAHDNPLTSRGLGWGQRLCYLATMINWAGGIFKLPIYLTPILMLLTGIPPVREFTWLLAGIMGMYMAVAILGVKYVSNGYGSVWYSELFTMASFWTQVRGTMRALFWRKFQQFVVTLKRGRQSKSIWPYIRPQVYLIVLSILALSWAWGRLWFGVSDDYFKPILATFWTLFHMLLAYLVVRRALWPDDRRFATRHIVHLPIAYELTSSLSTAHGDTGRGMGVTADLNEPGVGFIAYERLPIGGTLRMTVQSVGERVTCDGTIRVVREVTPHEGNLRAYRYGVAFAERTSAQSDALYRVCLHYAVPRLYGYYGHGHEAMGKAVRNRLAALFSRRRFTERHEFHLPVYLRAKGDNTILPVATEDVSRSALSVMLDREFVLGTDLEFTMPTPLGEVSGQARIVRNEKCVFAGRTFYRCVLEIVHFNEGGWPTFQALLNQGQRGCNRPALKPIRAPMPVPVNRPVTMSLAIALPLLLVEYGVFSWVYRDDLFLRAVASASAPVTGDDAARVERLFKETTAATYPSTDRLVLLGNALQRMDRPNELAEVTRLLAGRDMNNLDLQVALAFAYDLREEHDRAEEAFQRVREAIDAGRYPADRREQVMLGAARSSVHGGRLELARSHFEELIRLHPDKMAYRNELASVLLNSGHHADLLRLYASVEPDYEGRILMVMSRTAAHDYDGALRDARAILKDKPGDATAEGLVADVLSRQGNRVQARVIYERLLKANGDNLKIAIQLAHLSLWARNYAEALDRFQAIFDQNRDRAKLLEQHPEVGKAYVNAVASAPQIGPRQLEVARLLCENALTGNESDAAFLARLGWVLHRLGDDERSSTLLERAHALNPTDQAIRRQFASVLVAFGKPDEALQLLEGRETSLDARLLLVDIYVANKDLTSAVRECRALRAEQPDNRLVTEKLADLLSWKKEYAESLQLFEQLMRSDPYNSTYAERLAEVSLWSGDYSEALRRYETLLATDFDRPAAWWGFVDAAAGARQLTETQSRIAQIIATRVRNGEHKAERVLRVFARQGKELAEDSLLTRLAWVLIHHLHDASAAGTFLDQAVALKPVDPARRKELAGVLAAVGRTEDALRQYEGLPLAWQDHLALARIYAGGEQFESAARECRLALDRQPLDRDTQTLLADVQSWSGKHSLALAGYERLLRRFPDDAELRRRQAEAALWSGDALRAVGLFQSLLESGQDQSAVCSGFLEAVGRVERLTPAQTSLARRMVERPISVEAANVERMITVARVRYRHFGEKSAARALLRRAMDAKSRDAVALTRLAGAMDQFGDRTSANEVLGQALALKPKKSSVCMELSGVLTAVQRFKEARAILEDLSRTEPGNAALVSLLARVTFWSGDAATGLSLMEKALQGAFEQPAVWAAYVDAASAVPSGSMTPSQVELALRIAGQPIPAEAPDQATYLSRLGWVLHREGKKDRAAELLNKAVAQQPKDTAIRKELAGVLIAVGHAKQALPWLEEMARANPNDVDLHTRLAQAALWGGDPNGATVRLQVLLDAHFDQPNLWGVYVDAVAALRKGTMTRPQVDLALRIAAQAIPNGVPDRAAYLSRLAWTLHREGEKVRAAELIDKAIALAPRDPKTQREVAGVLMAAGRFKEARTYLEKQATDNPEDAVLMGQYALVVLWGGERETGLALLQKALEARFEQPELWGSYIDATSSMTRGTLTREQLQLMLRLAEQTVPDSVPDRVLYLSRLGWVLHREGEKTRAEQVIDKALALKSSEPTTRRELAGVLTAMGRNEAGLALYEGLKLTLEDRLQLVVLHSGARQFVEAKKQCETILAEQPDNARAMRWLADVTLWAAQFPDALKQYERLLSVQFEQPQLWPNYVEAASRVDHLTAPQLRTALRILDQSEKTTDPLFLARLALVLHREIEEPAALSRMSAGLVGLLASPMYSAPALAATVMTERANPTRATTLLHRAVELRPRDATTLARLGWVTHRMGQAPLAAQMLEQAIALKPVEPAVCREVGDALVAMGRFDVALPWFENLARAYPKDAELQMRLAEVTVWSGAYDRGIDRVAHLLEDDFKRKGLWHSYVDAAAGVSTMTEAQIELALRLADEPFPMEGDAARTTYLSRLAWALHREGERRHRTTWQVRVLDLLKRAMRIDSRDLDARRELAGMLTAAHQFKDALRLYEELVRRLPSDTDLRVRLAEVTLYMGDHGKALTRFEQLLHDGAAQPRTWRGFVDAASSVTEMTESQARAASRLAGERPRFDNPSEEATYLSRLSWVLAREGKRSKSNEMQTQADDLLDRAVALNPDDLDARIQLANMLSWKGRYAEAEKLSEAILRGNPDERRARVKLAEIALWSGDYDTALERFRLLLAKDWQQPDLWGNYLDAASSAKKLDAKTHGAIVLHIYAKVDLAASTDAVFLGRFAWVLRRLQESKRSIQILRRALELEPSSRTIRRQLAETLSEAGDVGEAEKHFRILLQAKGSR